MDEASFSFFVADVDVLGFASMGPSINNRVQLVGTVDLDGVMDI